MTDRFWQTLSLEQLSSAQWEALCDHCGKCCLHKLQDEDSGKIYFTQIACEQYDFERGCCACYPERARKVPDCQILRPEQLRVSHALPATCAYRLLAAGETLPVWHPLLTGDPDSVREAGVAITSYALPPEVLDDANDLENDVLEWLC